MSRLVRITTVPISLKLLITGQMKYMKEKGFDVIMMSADGPEINEVVEHEGCVHEIVPLTRRITPFKDLRALWILYGKLRRISPQIVHSHTPKAGLIGMIASWLARVPIRLHTVAGLPLEATTGWKRKLLLFIEWLTYFFATEVWPNSKSLLSFIESHKLASKKKLRIIGKGSSNGIDISEFDIKTLGDELIEKVKNEIRYNSENKYILFVGRIVKDKGVEELIDAFQKLKNNHANLKLILVGPVEAHLDPLSERSMKLINNDKDIIAPGFSKHVKYYMHLADLFVFPSHREGFPNVLMQAGLMNCPVVASKITGSVDIVENEKNGLLHEKGNSDDLFITVDYALNNPLRMQELNKNLQVKIKTHYNRNNIQDLIYKAYNSHLNSNTLDN